MQIINGNTVSKGKTKAIINKVLGRKSSFLEAYAKKGVGVAGLEYISGIEEIDQIRENLRLIANLETRSNGILIYLNNPEERYYVILPFKEIKSISYVKQNDILSPKPKSFFSKMLNMTDNYILSKRLLLEDEIIEENEAFLTIDSSQIFTLKNTKNNYNKAKEYLTTIQSKTKVTIDVSDYSIK